ncbi:hypothetical protein Metlim_0597 [Methanoplanus limicola DSM 2279]|uniref:Uncharacterized protein n=1 Tax=Methanoplanus limicola DSM 2279 TaxID=937775 RepID=H1Z2Z1_9EURY|nr:hypothetical protein Metlim_0597 [Methanoplanus limicola DSM 2279]
MTPEDIPDSDSGYDSYSGYDSDYNSESLSAPHFLPSDDIHQNVRRNVISAYKQISTIISIRNALRSKLDHSYIVLSIRDALRLEFKTPNFRQPIQIPETETKTKTKTKTKTDESHPHQYPYPHSHLHQKISGGI